MVSKRHVDAGRRLQRFQRPIGALPAEGSSPIRSLSADDRILRHRQFLRAIGAMPIFPHPKAVQEQEAKGHAAHKA